MTTKHAQGRLSTHACNVFSEQTNETIAVTMCEGTRRKGDPYKVPATIEEAWANAARLALCWNTHDELLKACQLILSINDNPQAQSHPISLDPNAREQLRAAIRKAGGDAA